MSPRLRRMMVLFAPILFGCAANNGETPSKEEARALGGKQDHIDLCDAFHWYGDGVCDDFCPQWDEDCGPADLQTCNRTLGFECPSDHYCHYGPEGSRVGCEVGINAGICRPRPDECAEIFAPVCGCDGTTYGNECEAHAAGVSVAEEGECEQPECVVAGCSRELCIEEGEPGTTTCELRPGAACYSRHSQCERQPGGECGWTPTDELNQCLENSLGADCRTTGCREGSSCSFCFGRFSCMPDGSMC